MARHREPRPARRSVARSAAVALAGLLVVAGIAGTYAFWVDSATVTSGSITSGSMDLQVSGDASTWGAIGIGTAFSASGIASADITPSESHAFGLHVRNVGAADLTYTGTVVRGSTWTFVSDPITVRFYAGGTPSVDTTYPIQQTCSAGTALGPAVTVGATNTAVFSAARALAHSTSDALCVEVEMTAGADNSNQGKSGILRLDLAATQVTS